MGTRNTLSTRNSPPADTLASIVAAIERAYEAGDRAETLRLLEWDTLAAWFGLEHERFAQIVEDAVRSGAASESFMFGLRAFMSSAADPGFAVESASEQPRTHQDALALQVGRMFALRLQGRPAAALRAAQAVEPEIRSIQPLFDSRGGWTLFSAVQMGLTAMLAGDFPVALLHFTEAQMHAHVPALAFLHRDAYVRSALVHACFGDREQARTLLRKGERIPRTGSWSEDSIDASAEIVAVLVSEDEPMQRYEALAMLDLSRVGEMWPFYVVALQRLAAQTGRHGEARERIEALDRMPLPRLDGEGFSGSVIPVTLAGLAMQGGNRGAARALLGRADLTIASSQVFSAMLELVCGRPAETLRVAHRVTSAVKGLRQMELWRLAALAGGHLALGQPAESLAAVRQAMELPRPLTEAETDVFPVEVAALAQKHLPAWPRAGEQRHGSPASLSLTEPLAPEELRILELLAQGLTEHEVALRQFVPCTALAAQLDVLLPKLQAETVAGAVLEAQHRGLI